MYDAKGKLTRDGAIQVLRGGGTVMIKGTVYGSVEKLPGEAEFAKGDEAAETAAAERLQKTIEDAQKQLASLKPKGK